jgi:hypothetical protein
MVDIEAIKRKLAQLNGEKGTSEFGKTWWRPKGIGTHNIRIVPWQDNKGQPFKEMWYYKNIGVKDARGYGPFPTPTREQFKLKDPIQELINHLRADEDGATANKALLKKLYPKMSAIVPIIVRGEEELGVRLWAIQDLKGVYQNLLSYFVKDSVLEETHDYTDVKKGFDIEVTIFKSDRVWNGKPVNEMKVELGRKLCPLSKDEKQIEKWISSIPDLSSIEPVLEYDQLKKRLDDWMNSSDDDAKASADSTEERGSTSGADDLDALTESLGATDDSSAEKKSKKPVEKAAAAEEEKPAPKPAKPAAKKKSDEVEKGLDQMFEDLENGN